LSATRRTSRTARRVPGLVRSGCDARQGSHADPLDGLRIDVAGRGIANAAGGAGGQSRESRVSSALIDSAGRTRAEAPRAADRGRSDQSVIHPTVRTTPPPPPNMSNHHRSLRKAALVTGAGAASDARSRAGSHARCCGRGQTTRAAENAADTVSLIEAEAEGVAVVADCRDDGAGRRPGETHRRRVGWPRHQR